MRSDAERRRALAVADLAAVVERAAGDLALAEEPANFLVALATDTPPTDRSPSAPAPPPPAGP